MSINSTFTTAINEGKIAGAIILAGDSKGNQYKNLLGKRTLPSGATQPFQTDDVICLASGSKLLTTLTALTCVEDGLLNLDDPIKIEDLPDKVLVSYEEEPVYEPAKDMTLRHLLTHTSGLVYHFTTPSIAKWRDENSTTAQKSEPRPVNKLFNYPLGFQPGSSWMYGTSLDWAGYYLSHVTGSPVIDRLRSRVIHSQDVEFYPAKSLHDRKIDNNPWDDGKGKAVFGGDAEIQETSRGEFGGQGLFTTSDAYFSVLKSLLKNDGKILKPETVDMMFNDHLRDAREGFDKALEGSWGRFFRLGTTQKVGYGLGGLITLEDVPGWYGEKTLTWGGGLTLTWFIDRKNDICGLCAIQGKLPQDIEILEELKQVFRKEIYQEKKEWK